jgi:hypothetical protein
VLEVAVAVVLLLLACLTAKVEARHHFGNMDSSSDIGSAKYQYISSGNNVHILIQHNVPCLQNKLDTFRICAKGSSYVHGALTSSEFTENMAL